MTKYVSVNQYIYQEGCLSMENKKILADLTEIIEKQNKSIESIEKLLKMMIVNGVLREIEDSIFDGYQRVDSEIEDLLLENGLTVGDFCLINGKMILNIIVPKEIKISVTKVIGIQKACKSRGETYDICFCFKSLHGNQRKRLMEEHISFCIGGSETHVFTENY